MTTLQLDQRSLLTRLRGQVQNTRLPRRGVCRATPQLLAFDDHRSQSCRALFILSSGVNTIMDVINQPSTSFLPNIAEEHPLYYFYDGSISFEVRVATRSDPGLC